MIWEFILRGSDFLPLDMKDSNTSFTDLLASSNLALAYGEVNGEVKEIPHMNLEILGGAGSINSTLLDMLQWAKLHLNQGIYAGQLMVSENTIQQMHTPQIVIQEPLQFPKVLNPCYGLGWRVMAYRGHRMLKHGGNVTGFSSQLVLLPKDNLGIVILSNKNPNLMLPVVLYTALDRLLQLDEIDWNQRIHDSYQEMKLKVEKKKVQNQANRIQGTKLSHHLDDYIGVYEHSGYGKVMIESGMEGLIISHNNMAFPLNHYHYDIFEYTVAELEIDLKVFFSTDVKGNINKVSIPMESGVKNIEFLRIR